MIFYTTILVASVLLLILTTDPSITAGSNTNNTNADITDDEVWRTWSIIINVDRAISWFFFTELILRFIVCPQKLSFLTEYYSWVDILGVLPWTVIVCLLHTSRDNITDVLNRQWVQIYINVAACLRVVRLINLSRHYIASRVFIITLWESRKEIVLLLSLYITVATFFAAATFFAEQNNDDDFPTMASGIWWAMITMAAVGYGDMYPRTELGKTIGAVCAFSGLICTALPVAVIAMNYNVIYRTARVRNELKKIKCEEHKNGAIL